MDSLKYVFIVLGTQFLYRNGQFYAREALSSLPTLIFPAPLAPPPSCGTNSKGSLFPRLSYLYLLNDKEGNGESLGTRLRYS